MGVILPTSKCITRENGSVKNSQLYRGMSILIVRSIFESIGERRYIPRNATAKSKMA